jgi:hypothetical protein
MVFICIYLGLIQSLKLEGGNASFTSHTKQFKTVCGANSPDSRLSSPNKKTSKSQQQPTGQKTTIQKNESCFHWQFLKFWLSWNSKSLEGSSCIPFLYGWKIDCAWGGLVTVLFSAQLLSFSLLRLVERLGISIQERESQAVKLAVTIVWGVKSHACKALWSRLQEFIAKLKSGNATSGNKKISVWGKINK